MKIVHTINSLAMGGAENLVLLELLELNRRGHDTTVVTLWPGEYNMTKRFESAGLNVRSLSNAKYRSIPEYVKLIKSLDPDVLHTHLYPSLLYGNVAQAIGGPFRFFHTEHNTTNNRRKFYLWPFDVGMYLQLKKLICISKGVLTATTQWNPLLREGKAIVIENTFSPSEQKKCYERQGNRIRLLSVGRLVHDKNYPLQLRLLQSLPNLELDIFGDGPLRQELEEMAVSLNIAPRVRFMGIHPNLAQHYRDYDAYLHTATLEGFGLVVAEAMSAGLPVFVPNIPGVSAVVGDAGYIYASDCLPDLRSIIEKVFCKDASELEMIGMRAIQASRRFSIQGHVDKLEKLYLG